MRRDHARPVADLVHELGAEQIDEQLHAEVKRDQQRHLVKAEAK